MPVTERFRNALKRLRRNHSLKDENAPPAPDPAENLTPSDPTENPSPPTRVSCWSQAVNDLQTSNPSLYERLKEVDQKEKDAPALEKMFEEKRPKHFKVPHWEEISLKFMLKFQNIAIAAASFDPHKAAPIAV